jgi:hypothetical protein
MDMAFASASPIDDVRRPAESLETFHLLWLGCDTDMSEERQNIQKQLRATINRHKIFDSMRECQEYIEEISKQDRVILIVSDRLASEVIPCIHHVRQLSAIYIYCMNKLQTIPWIKTFSKVEYRDSALM